MLQHLITQDEDLRMVPTDHDQLTTAVEKIREELQALPEGADIARTRVLARWAGIGLLSLGHHDDARVFLRQALDLATASGNSRAVIATELNLADAYRYAGEAQTAEVLSAGPWTAPEASTRNSSTSPSSTSASTSWSRAASPWPAPTFRKPCGCGPPRATPG
ncbi:hypothetical protein Snoj_28520 [Streptomyces nojiriensis]|uniref:Tetratricopeptide repeat protein n=1 Tax=Streptomyces nojiriensis TaxID=66374 RepID=A0ABQ3SLB2_9ACTN|nr:hypothetical protein GCM10010205_81080 [Streptomyces nojiriensis]GHI68934.1 hypothetical protein Snoj_28520 [Streptomyces nojiriensis]